MAEALLVFEELATASRLGEDALKGSEASLEASLQLEKASAAFNSSKGFLEDVSSTIGKDGKLEITGVNGDVIELSELVGDLHNGNIEGFFEKLGIADQLSPEIRSTFEEAKASPELSAAHDTEELAKIKNTENISTKEIESGEELENITKEEPNDTEEIKKEKQKFEKKIKEMKEKLESKGSKNWERAKTLAKGAAIGFVMWEFIKSHQNSQNGCWFYKIGGSKCKVNQYTCDKDLVKKNSADNCQHGDLPDGHISPDIHPCSGPLNKGKCSALCVCNDKYKCRKNGGIYRCVNMSFWDSFNDINQNLIGTGDQALSAGENTIAGLSKLIAGFKNILSGGLSRLLLFAFLGLIILTVVSRLVEG
jgi:hypothetical protein